MTVLSTRQAKDNEVQLAKKMGFRLINYPVLRFSFREPGKQELDKLQEEAPDAWVFTSKNGVEGFMRIFEQGMIPLKPKKIFAVGNKTASKLAEHGFTAGVAGTENGTALANLIVDDPSVGSVVHFCGSRRRDELSVILTRQTILVTELVVYHAMEAHPPVENLPSDVHAVLFYSPGSVNAFGSALDRYHDIPVVAIGSTTGEVLRQNTDKEVIIAEEASTESMLKALAQFASKKKNADKK
ncbi:MAG: uroporphyrinogen-III synthase [Balneolales bacterium]